MTDINHLSKAIDELKSLNSKRLFIGAFIPGNDQDIETLQMILGVQETGATIKPVNSKYLTIPTKYAGRNKARNIPGLFFYITKTKGQPALARVDDGQLHVYFLLAEQVVIPSRPVLLTTAELCSLPASKLIKRGINKILVGEMDAMGLLAEVGEMFKLALKEQISSWDTPPNAQITASRKGFNNPLIDAKTLLNSIDWMVV